ncbi:MaoC family dehydratase [Aeromonas simiae]|uniref:MaoC family dehydratase n=1 Tax=Aeromonas simiae TaxID=218936 RepID=UPI0005A761DD|nr:MaoC family dehydratase [Aeromonas simiae]MDO2947415.1 MaoC family dehydratase [Aeromonas simiae]MDO2951036.1 MaoC family dehydratase [Aeromonas simiae]MDO2954629.1 MaoC family dehydratase [Aeromonas simiae]
MKVVDFLKRKKEILAQHPFELKDWLSPAIRDYWREFQQKAQHHPLFGRVMDGAITTLQPEPQVVNGVAQPSLDPAIELEGEAAAVFETLLSQVGEETHIGEWLLVDQAMINGFAQATGDHQWIHTNPERAAEESPFKSTIAHGFLTLALLPRLTGSVDEHNPEFPTARMVVNFGLDSVRFPYPIKVDSRIRARTKLAKVSPIKGGIELLKEIKVEIEGIRRPGCVIESLTRLYF